MTKDDLIYDLLSEIAGLGTHDINLRDHTKAYDAVEKFLEKLAEFYISPFTEQDKKNIMERMMNGIPLEGLGLRIIHAKDAILIVRSGAPLLSVS